MNIVQQLEQTLINSVQYLYLFETSKNCLLIVSEKKIFATRFFSKRMVTPTGDFLSQADFSTDQEWPQIAT